MSRTFSPIAVSAAFAASLVGCGGGGDDAPHVSLPAFNDISSAPMPIQTAAAAVVRVRTALEVATGSFISPTGLLLTNNHVLGVRVCPQEGCFVEVTRMLQRGSSDIKPDVLFGVPVAVDVGLDMAVVQLYDAPGGSMVGSPHFLTLAQVDAASLVGKHIAIVGHPEGHLKKWTDGVVTDLDGEWFLTNAYTLPGDSGSPVLDDAGGMVGVIHRGAVGEDLFSSNNVNVFSLGTASAQLAATMTAPLPAAMVSTAAETTEEKVVDNDAVYLNARVPTVTVNGQQDSVLAILGRACDAALARQDFQSPDDLSGALVPCYHAMTWIECRSEVSGGSNGTQCPTGDVAAAWSARFQTINSTWVAMNGQLDLYAVSFAVSHLQASFAEGVTAGAATLSDALARSQPPLDFGLANYLAAYEMFSYGGTSIIEYVENYQRVLHYEMQASSISSTASWLLSKGQLRRDQAFSIWSRLAADPNVSIGAKLSVEELRFHSGAL